MDTEELTLEELAKLEEQAAAIEDYHAHVNSALDNQIARALQDG